jgi:hypothetical protein
MPTPALLLALAALLNVGNSAADVVTLKDGTEVLGQVVSPSKKGKTVLIVRRHWAETHLPDRAKAWRAAEAPWMARSRAQRLHRLEAWRDQRTHAGRDSLLDWIDAQIAYLKTLGDNEDLPPLMMAAIDHHEVKSVSTRPPEQKRLLRQGWKARFPDVETMPVASLRRALEGRNFSPDDPAPITDLLPLPIESDSAWLTRRAATEVSQDDGLRFVKYQGLVLPEDAMNGGQVQLDASTVSGLLGSILGGPGADADNGLSARLRALEANGKVGAILTTLEMAPDLSSVQIESVLLVRQAPENWRPAIRRTSIIRPDQVQPGAGEVLADDPQVKAAFGLVESLGLGQISPEMKQTSLLMGAAVQKALGQARTLLLADLERLALPVGSAPGP